MAIVWPVTIPDEFMDDGFAESPPDNSIRSQTDIGPPKIRRRSTAGIRPIVGQQKMTSAQVATLDTFYVTTTQSGSLDFEKKNPRTGSTVNMVFSKPPRYRPAGGDYWFVDLELEQLP